MNREPTSAGTARDLRRRRLRFLKLRRRKQRAATMSMMEHLAELRTRLIYAAVAFVSLSAVAFFFFDPISNFLLRPLCSLPERVLGPQGCRLVFTGAVEPISVRLKVTAYAGLVASAPVWLYQLWAFIVPGLTPRERRYAMPFVVTSMLLFLIGVTFAYLTLPAGLRFLLSFAGENFVPFLAAKEYLSFVTLIVIVFGVVFELPILLFFLGLAGVIEPQQMRDARRGVIVGLAVLAAVVTPSQDPYTMLVMAIPLYLFYELTILLLAAINKRRNRASS